MRVVLLWGPVILHMALIFFVSSSADPGLPSQLSDKTAHVGAYGLLAVLILRALVGGFLRQATWPRAILAFVVTVLYGATDELHQRFVPERSPEVLDVVADAVGACAGVVLLMALQRLRMWRGTAQARPPG